MSDGRVMSGGGDGKVCVWPTGRGTVCQDLDGHASAVAKVMAVPDSRLALSGGYDGKVRGRLGPGRRCHISFSSHLALRTEVQRIIGLA